MPIEGGDAKRITWSPSGESARGWTPDGARRVIVFIGVTICSDIGGFAVGVVAGRHPMAPSVSPKKSWEGAAGSVVACMIAGVATVMLLLGGSWWAGAILGLSLAVTATVGDLTEYVVELATSGMQEYYRPNFFTNTPDILGEDLQHGGPPAFHARLVLAATLSPSYGIYSGFERFENVPVRPGSEEYEDSEKYEIKQRRLDGPLLPVVRELNAARRAHPALQRLENVRFLGTENDTLVAYMKRTGDDVVIVVVNIDPFAVQEGIADVPYESGLPPAYEVCDLLTGARYTWHVGRNFVRLNPGGAHVLVVG